MKKIYLALTVAAATAFASCDMDLAPVGSLDDTSAIESVTDLMKARNGIYENLRSISAGGYIFKSDIQMDQFLGVTINGNQNGSFAHGTVYSNNGDIEGIWAGCYTMIANANFLLDHADRVINATGEGSEDRLEAERYVAETKFARAYYYYYLFDKFCQSYTADKADTPALGLPLVTVFNPTGDIAAYPGRSTMNETFKLIDTDLKDAYDGLIAYEQGAGYTPAPMDAYVNSNVVLALQARLALLRQDWKTAISKAQELINTGAYTLAGLDDYADMWVYDSSDEIIFRPISTKTERGIGSIGGAYIDAKPDMAYYMPTFPWCYEAYAENDVRWEAFFEARYLLANAQTYPGFAFNKFPGNPDLNASTTNDLLNMGKPFRLSETYLILAEAAYNDGNETLANQALNTLRENRLLPEDLDNDGVDDALPTFTGVTLRDQIREERAKELIGEGFRMSDLRRWGLGFTRDKEYPISNLADIFVAVDTEVVYLPGDYRYVWPIPSTEMENNPQLKGQQNPGY